MVGVDYQPNERFSLVVEGFYKTYRHYPISILEDVSLAARWRRLGGAPYTPIDA